MKNQTQNTALKKAFYLFGGLLFVAVIAIGTLMPTAKQGLASADTVGISVQPLWPTNYTRINKTVTLQFYTSGLKADQYEPFWSVDNGKWNRMSFSTTNDQVATATVDVSDWTWNSNSQYKLSMIALVKDGWQPITTNLAVTVSNSPVAAAPVAQTGTSPSAQPKQSTQTATPSPAATMSLYIDQTGDTASHALASAKTDSTNANRFNKLATTPIANWYGDWNNDVQADTNRYVSAAKTAGQMPVLVAYNIPKRDCGSYSSGGAASASAYIDWVNKFAAGIGKRPAFIVLEPDALANMDCLSTTDQAQRTDLLSQAVTILRNQTSASVYLDAGNPYWQSAATMAVRLKAANIASATGFSLNVSNFFTSSDNITYGAKLSNLTNGKHFIIDTSRNGNGPTADHQWCNPAGRAVGTMPSLQTGTTLADAYLWIKGPGTSDGDCSLSDGSKAPAAGTWWPAGALELVKNAGY